MAKHYIIKEGKIIRTNPFCPRCGRGVFMADHGDFWVCGKCGIRYNKEFFGKYRTRNEDIADSTITPERL